MDEQRTQQRRHGAGLRDGEAAGGHGGRWPMRPCAWCAAEFVVARRPGRPRLYCNHTCRQRAYEHRHGFLHERTVRPLPGQVEGETRLGSGYERGGWGFAGAKVHALRTSVRPEGRRRETMCGLLMAPIAGKWFSPVHPAACAVCSTAVATQPLHHPISASNELSRLRAVIQEAAERRIDPSATLAWMRGNEPRTADRRGRGHASARRRPPRQKPRPKRR